MFKQLHTVARQNGKFIWTTPYYGVTHCGNFGHGECWVSVTDFGSFATVDKFDWRREKLICLTTEEYPSKTQAITVSEKWMESVGY